MDASVQEDVANDDKVVQYGEGYHILPLLCLLMHNTHAIMVVEHGLIFIKRQT